MSLAERIESLLEAYDMASAEVTKSRALLAEHFRAWKAGLIGDEYMAGIASTEGELSGEAIVWTFRDAAARVKQSELEDELNS